MSSTKCLFVSVVGEPNSGKSTLVNSMVGKKVSIVSHKVQTTRRQIRGVAHVDNVQMVFIDTPGFCKSNSSLEKVILTNFKKSYKDSDLILLLIDATSKNLVPTFKFIEKSRGLKNMFAVAINKVDFAKKESILKIADQLLAYDFVKKVFMISALTNDGVEDLKRFIQEEAIEGPWMFDKEQTTDSDLKFRLSEVTREKLFKRLEKELPYSIYVETESVRESNGKAEVHQSIVVMKDSQKGIILGNKGKMIGAVREDSIKDMREIIRKNVKLRLFVKVRDGWTENKEYLRDAGIID
jgi:GTP-binding protein Era